MFNAAESERSRVFKPAANTETLSRRGGSRELVAGAPAGRCCFPETGDRAGCYDPVEKTNVRFQARLWWYRFVWNSELIRKSTKQSNKGLAEADRGHPQGFAREGRSRHPREKRVPSLADFAPTFKEAIRVRCAAKPRTVTFYEEKLQRLMEYAPLRRCRLDRIDEELIEAYVQERREKVAPATVNRQLATLRRMLRLAYEWKILDRLPRIRLLAGERSREFVLSFEQETKYLAKAEQPLQDVAALLLDTGLRVGEALQLQ